MRRKSTAVFGVVFGFLLLALPVLAHHSFEAEFDGSKTLTLKGVVSKVDWTNPHVYIYLDVKDAEGKVTTWAIESHPTGRMHLAGITRQMLGEGQTVTAEVFPAKDGSKSLGNLHKITFADGHFIQM